MSVSGRLLSTITGGIARPRRTYDMLYVGGLALLSTVLTVVLAIQYGFVKWTGDATIYAQMADHPTTFTYPNWGYRLLTPWMVHIIPGSHDVGFWLVSIFGVAATATVLGLLCRDAGLSRHAGYAAAVLFILSFGARFDLEDFRLVDPLTYLGTVLTFWFLIRRQSIAAAVTVVLTVINHEWALFLIVPLIWAVARDYNENRRLEVWALGIGVVGTIAVFWLIRHWPGFGSGQYNNWYGTAIYNAFRGKDGDPVDAMALALGCLWILAPIGWWRARGALRLTPLILPFVLLMWGQSGSLELDRGRMMAYAFPCIIPLFLSAIDGIGQSRWWTITVLGALSLLLDQWAPVTWGLAKALGVTLGDWRTGVVIILAVAIAVVWSTTPLPLPPILVPKPADAGRRTPAVRPTTPRPSDPQTVGMVGQQRQGARQEEPSRADSRERAGATNLPVARGDGEGDPTADAEPDAGQSGIPGTAPVRRRRRRPDRMRPTRE